MTFQLLDVRRPKSTAKARLITMRYWGATASDLWCEVEARKVSKCAVSGKPIVRGSAIYRPLTNLAHRGLRILVSEIP